MDLNRQFLINIFSSWYAQAVRVGIAFFFVPYITTSLGDERYGIWVIIFQTICYFYLLDLGVSAALLRFVSKYLGEENFDKINRLLNTANLFYLGVGLVTSVSIYLFAVYFFDVFQISSEAIYAEGVTALSILAILIGLRFILLPFGGSLASFQRQDLVNILNIVEEITRAAVLIYILSLGEGLVEMAIAATVIHLTRHLAGVIILKKLYPQIKFSLKKIDAKIASSLLHYSKTAFGISIGWMLIFNSDSILLGLISSSSAAGIYNPAVQLMFHLRMTVNAIGLPLIPAVSHLESTTDLETVRRLYLRVLKYTAYLSFLTCTCVFLYANSFVALWLPEEFMPAGPVMQILAVSGAFFLPQIMGHSVLLGLGKHSKLLLVLILEVAFKILLAIFLVREYGLLGMAVATALPQFLIYTTIYPFFLADIMKTKWHSIMKEVLMPGIIAALVTAAAALPMMTFLEPASWSALLINGAVILLANLYPALKIIEPKDLDKLKNLFKRK
ncbi:MAG: oligosaccharide flippase family protein [candidate division Zixibacteria bacterium]|nr:oligosaccharide flippase family protein [candidate division Zixibacteria bacterium]